MEIRRALADRRAHGVTLPRGLGCSWPVLASAGRCLPPPPPEAGAVANLSEADNRMLRSMARALVVTLRIMKRLGHVILVTNAETGRPPRHPGRGVGVFSGGV